MARSRSQPANRTSPIWLALAFIGLLAAFCLLPRVNSNPRLLGGFWAAVGALLVLFFVVRGKALRNGRTLTIEFVPRSVHYVQFAMHISVYAYWGWYWREVYHDIPLIAAQIVFAFALDMLVCWTRRDKWLLGFGPIPIVLSTNLFLWFKDDWFALQFVMVATGVLGKELIRWRREGRLTHIFNPSALALFVFSVVLIATKSTDLTWGVEIANTLHRPPQIYLEIFFLGLIVQALFGVTLVTLASAATLFALNLWYTHTTGLYHFVDSGIPVSVFLGLHLLVTDPATSPRKNLGKFIFGALYGAGVFGMYTILGRIGAPHFYDKLLCVPALNLCVRALDRASEAVSARFRWPTWTFRWNPQKLNYAHMTVWVSLFTVMTSTGFLTKGRAHPGGNPEFWRQACEQGQKDGCDTWVRTLETECKANSAADCFQLGKLTNEGRMVPRDPSVAGLSFGRACDLGISQACTALIEFVRSDGKDVFLKGCDRGDGASCFLLGSLYSSGLGVPQTPGTAFALFTQSCAKGWWRGCGRLAQSYLWGQGTPVNVGLAIENFEKACQGRNAASCVEVAKLYHRGIAGPPDERLALQRLQEACGLGLQTACQAAGSASAMNAKAAGGAIVAASH